MFCGMFWLPQTTSLKGEELLSLALIRPTPKIIRKVIHIQARRQVPHYTVLYVKDSGKIKRQS